MDKKILSYVRERPAYQRRFIRNQGLNVADLPDGVYFYTYLSSHRIYESKFLVSKTK